MELGVDNTGVVDWPNYHVLGLLAGPSQGTTPPRSDNKARPRD
jgi:hypothetical protein